MEHKVIMVVQLLLFNRNFYFQEGKVRIVLFKKNVDWATFLQHTDLYQLFLKAPGN